MFWITSHNPILMVVLDGTEEKYIQNMFPLNAQISSNSK